MASKAIKGSEVVEKGFLSNAKKEATELTGELKKLDEGLKVVYKDTVALMKLQKDPKNAKEVKALTENLEKSQKVRKSIISIEEQQIKQKEKLSQLRTKEAKELAKTREAIRQENQELKNNVKRREGAIGSLNRQRATLIAARKRFDALSKAERENAAIGGRLSRVITKLDTDVKRLEKSTGRSQRNVGAYGDAWGRIGNMFRSGLGVLGITAGIVGLVRVVGDAFKRIREFDKELQNMAGISGSTREELATVETAIRTVAGESIKTSNEVAKLATTLFTLGKTREEVILMLKPVNDLSIALNTTSEEAADFLGQTLNAFGKGAESSQEFADIIANVRSSTSLDFQRIKDALGFVAPTANALGLSLGEISAQIGVLQDNGIKAARAGRLLNTSFARLIEKGLTLEDALLKINTAEDKVKTATEIFGKESFTLGLILADNVDKTARLANEFDNLSEGSLKKLTDEQLKSLDAQLKILDSTWEDFILSIEKGDGVFSSFIKGAVTGITNLLRGLKDLNDFGEVLPENFRELVKAQEEVLDHTRFINLELEKGTTPLQLRIKLNQDLADAHLRLSKILEDGSRADSDAILEQARINAIKSGLALIETIKSEGDATEEETVIIEDNTKARKDNSEEIKTSNRLRDLTTQNIEDQQKREITAIVDRFDDEVKKKGTSHEILIQLQIKLWRDLEAIDKKFQDKKDADEKSEAKKRFDDDLAQAIKEGEALNKVKKDALAKEAEAREEAFRQGQGLIQATSNELERKAQREVELINNSIRRNADAIATQEKLAIAGKENQLAFEQAEADKLALQQKEAAEKLARQQEILQITEAYWGFLNTRLANNEESSEALRGAATDTLFARGFSKGLVQFAATGNEDIQGAGSTTSDSIPFMLSKHERVMTAQQNAKVGGMSNEDLANLAFKYNSGMIEGVSRKGFDDMSKASSFSNIENSILLQGQGETINLLKAIKNKPVQQVNVGKLNELIETIYQDGRKLTINHANNRKRLKR